MRSKRWSLLLSAVLVLALAACESIGSGIGTGDPGGAPTTVAPDPTDAPPDTSPPSTEAPPATDVPSDDESTTNVLLFLGLLLLAILLVGVLIGRSRRKPAAAPVQSPPASPRQGFTEFARDGYSEARWLLDAFTDELAIWRGNALFDDSTSPEDSAGTSLSTTWAQLDDRMNTATDQLYRAEASAPDQNTAATVRATIAALNGTRAALDARAEARFNTRRADSQFDLAEAGERERIASSSLAENKQALNDSLLALRAVL